MTNLKSLSPHTISCLRFAILPIITALLGKYLFEAMILDFPLLNKYITKQLSINNDAITSLVSLSEFKARLLWLTSVLLYFFINVCFFYFLWSILNKANKKDRLALKLFAAIFSLFEIIYLSYIDSSSSPLNNIFRFTYDSLIASNLLRPSALSAIYFLLSTINVIAIFAVFFCVISGCCIIKQPANNIIQLNKQFLLLKDLIKGASAIMIAGIIHMQLWLSWPLSLTPNMSKLTELRDVISTIILFWGVCFSLTIAALYLPITIHLRNRANELYEASDSQADNRHDSPVFQSSSAQITQIVTILGPMLAGTIGPALSSILSV